MLGVYKAALKKVSKHRHCNVDEGTNRKVSAFFYVQSTPWF